MLTDESLGELNGAQRRAAERIEEKLLEAQRQLEQLEAMTRLGVLDSDPAPVVLCDAVQAAIGRAQAKADLRQGHIELHGNRDVRGLVDNALLDRILDNLFDNALSYSDEPPRVVAEVGRDGAAFIRVRDAGLGLDRQTAANVFAKWFRGDALDSERPGSGLGLYLSRQAARRMDGDLELEWSEPGVGTSFRLTLPTPA